VVVILTFAITALFRHHHHSTSSPPPRLEFVAHEKRDNSTQGCLGFQGNSDTYGLGIRIGLYFQWATSSIAYTFVREEAVTMRGVNNCFQLAMFAGLLYLTITLGEQLHAVEAYLMLVFCMGGVCTGTSNSDDDGDDHNNTTRNGVDRIVHRGYEFFDTSTLGAFIRLMLTMGFIAYGLWFVFHGMDHMQPPMVSGRIIALCMCFSLLKSIFLDGFVLC